MRLQTGLVRASKELTTMRHNTPYSWDCSITLVETMLKVSPIVLRTSNLIFKIEAMDICLKLMLKILISFVGHKPWENKINGECLLILKCLFYQWTGRKKLPIQVHTNYFSCNHTKKARGRFINISRFFSRGKNWHDGTSFGENYPRSGPACRDDFTMSFYMAPKVTDPPKPTNPNVTLSSLPAQTVYVR